MPEPFDPTAIFRVLDEHEVEYVLIGGLAAVLRGSTAMTSDAEVVPAPYEENLVRLAAALRDLGARLRSERDPKGVAFDPHPALLAGMATLNTTTRHGDLDIAFRPTGVDSYESLREASTIFELHSMSMTVASLADVIRSKEAAARPKDHAMLPILYALRDEIERS